MGFVGVVESRSWFWAVGLRGVSVVAGDPSESRLGDGLELVVINRNFARFKRILPNCRPSLRSKAGWSDPLDLGLPRRRIYVVRNDVTPSITPVQTLIPARSLRLVWLTNP